MARIYARFLASVGALPGKGFVEITGSALANEGVPGAKKIIDRLVNAGGGVTEHSDSTEKQSQYVSQSFT